jgi:hypothetical protein
MDDFTISIHHNPPQRHPPHHRHLRLAFVVKTGRHRRHGHGHRWRHKRVHIFEPGVTHMNITDSVTVGHQVAFAWEWIDANGNPPPAGTTLPTPDSTPVWANTPATPPVDTFTSSADGSTALLVASAAGSDTVTLTVVFGGTTFTASDLVTISAAVVPFVPAGVQITSVVS